MKSIPLQLVTIQLENGQHGVFVGLPLIPEANDAQVGQVSEIWFSNIKNIPQTIPLDQLIALVQAQLCRCMGEMH